MRAKSFNQIVAGAETAEVGKGPLINILDALAQSARQES
jgi:hypothetical protein